MEDEQQMTASPVDTQATTTSTGGPVETPPAPESLSTEALQAVEQITEATVPAAIAGAETGGAEGAETAALDSIERSAEAFGPPIEHAGWNAIKAWIRQEVALMQAGHSEETRKVLNP